MELHGEDWKREWDDADRKRMGNMYGWRFGALLLIAAVVFAGLLFS